MAPLRIEVSGNSTIYLPAERAVISVAVRSEGASQDEVAKNVASTSAQLRDLLTSLAGKDEKGEPRDDAAVTHWSSTNLSTGSFFKYDDDGNKQGRIYQASVTFDAKFKDFSRLGSIATTLSTMEHVSIGDVSWQLTEKTKAKYTTKSRQQAVREAVSKAKDFAEALGRSVPPPVTQICDAGAGVSLSAPMAMAFRGAPVEEQNNLQFVPEDVSLECTVTVICEEK